MIKDVEGLKNRIKKGIDGIEKEMLEPTTTHEEHATMKGAVMSMRGILVLVDRYDEEDESYEWYKSNLGLDE